ncbi:hypothetical protein Leryth_020158 [Lithospermum erythrorhizon]|nr:hypothetical protein Leryth_020158 [Lithospermum erythrorhizon]
MARDPNGSVSFSRRYFNWKKKPEDDQDNDDEIILTFNSSSSHEFHATIPYVQVVKTPKKKLPTSSVTSKLISAFTFGKNKTNSTKMIGTIFGYRRGHVHIAFQENPTSNTLFFIEFPTQTRVLVKEMASGQVRIALECDKKGDKKGPKLVDEQIWRTYCNGKKCGYALKRECGVEQWKVLNSIGAITMGAGVLPGNNGEVVGEEGDLMYMRAKFERVLGSKDSESFYMMNPDGHGGPELSIYLLRN